PFCRFRNLASRAAERTPPNVAKISLIFTKHYLLACEKVSIVDIIGRGKREPLEPAMTISGQATAWEPRYAHRAQHMIASEIRELLKVLERPNVVSFAGGIPDPALFPVAEIGAAYADVLSHPTSAGAGLQ